MPSIIFQDININKPLKMFMFCKDYRLSLGLRLNPRLKFRGFNMIDRMRSQRSAVQVYQKRCETLAPLR